MVTRLLIIDDEEVFREDLAGLLRRRGITCYTAASGEEGVKLAQDIEPAVVLCDVKMPGMNGIDTLDAILRTSPETSVIMVTAYGDIETAIAAFRKGACDYVVKPVIVEDVFAKVSRLLDHRQLSEEVK
jgi:DNA-binding NtrC family response regulator